MEHRNTVHKYQTYFQARLVYLPCKQDQLLLWINLL
jgi:hypothetical protein